MLIVEFEEVVSRTRVASVDLNEYAGKWYVIASIPRKSEKKRNFITETYTLNKKGSIDIKTSYIKQNKSKRQFFKSKGFPQKGSNNFKWKVQFLWPFKRDYIIEELAEDYSYVVVGHPKKKCLYIMSRLNYMNIDQYLEIIKRCSARGYNISNIRRVPQ